MPARCYDRNKKRCYELASIVAAKLVADPSLIEVGRSYLERHVKDDPAQQPNYELWTEIMKLSPEEIASRLLANTAEGSRLRDTRPVFYIPSCTERKEAFDRVRSAAAVR